MTHAASEHYEFECVAAGSSTAGKDYHIGMCECTSTGTMDMSLDAAGSASRCQSVPTFSVPKCLPEQSVAWMSNRAGGILPFQGVAIAAPAGNPYCFAVRYMCEYNTCYPTGEYYGIQGITFSGGDSSASTRDFSGDNAASVRTFSGFVPSVKC